ncbi:Putative formate dehydrogenase oxidoreductase protein [Labilithrix luteola]|uniref:Putative formate dehydrogenase oxidoreductase protein n=1 Tax=Labilithrix luteola TaxID=1391654 RepID=A0A0K1PKK7_9BACT|nr:hypothetical protein [Labilithrix luteola]AKU93644.1 Putative formate dehydrogenase oxidoreductase protein [Labilithrix luteola]
MGTPQRGLPLALDKEFGIHAPREHGDDAVETLHDLNDRAVKMFFAISGNLLQAAPDTQYAAQGFCRVPLAVHVSTKLHRGLDRGEARAGFTVLRPRRSGRAYGQAPGRDRGGHDGNRQSIVRKRDAGL